MQTFLPYSSYRESAKSLDSKRLNKQILECYQILNVLSGQSKSGAWSRHPAVLMWEGSEHQLYDYAMVMIKEASMRGIKTDKNFENIQKLHDQFSSSWGNSSPVWYSVKHRMHVNITHRVNLYKKDPVYYAQFGKYVDDQYNVPCCEKCNYYWATHKERDDINR